MKTFQNKELNSLEDFYFPNPMPPELVVDIPRSCQLISAFQIKIPMGICCPRHSILTPSSNGVGSSLIFRGRSKESSDQFHPFAAVTSFTFRLPSSLFKGPYTKSLIGPCGDQLSVQNLRLLSFPMTHFVPALKTSCPFLIPFHAWEQGSLSLLTEFVLRRLQYLFLRTLAHKVSFFEWNLQLSFANKEVFLPLVDCNPRPPSFLGLVTFYQPTQCIFLEASVEPHKKFLLILSMPSNTLLGR